MICHRYSDIVIDCLDKYCLTHNTEKIEAKAGQIDFSKELSNMDEFNE